MACALTQPHHYSTFNWLYTSIPATNQLLVCTDYGGDDEKFKLIVKAHFVLSSPQRRYRYDMGEDEGGSDRCRGSIIIMFPQKKVRTLQCNPLFNPAKECYNVQV
jgi:hypothetical protein